MNAWFDLVFDGDFGTVSQGPETVLFVLALAFSLGQFVGWVYMRTHHGMSYSQTFVVSLVVLPIIVSLMIMLMVGSLLIAFGFLAVFAVVRFRNVLKDTRDTIFILWTLVEGMAVGIMRHSTAVVGGLVIGGVIIYLRATEFGTHQHYDAVLNLLWNGPDERSGMAALKQILRNHCSRIQVTNERRLGDQGLALGYRLLLRDPARGNELESALRQTAGFEDVSLFLREDETEV